MKYNRKKTLILQCLDKLPSSLGYYIYHRIQSFSLGKIDQKLKANYASLKKIKTILDHHCIDLNDKVVLEIGSGWYPFLPFLFKTEMNVNKVVTYDINKHYSKKRINQVKHIFGKKYDEKKLQRLNLPDFIEYHPNTDLTKVKIDKDISFIYSRFVLEHIKPDDIKEIHKKIYNELNDDVKILHLISPSDHRAYSDNSLSYYDFLKYSTKEWNTVQTKFDYHNRLRLPDYIEIFNNTGFKISYLDHDYVDKKSTKYKKFKALKLHQDYQKFTEREILAGSIFALLEKF